MLDELVDVIETLKSRINNSTALFCRGTRSSDADVSDRPFAAGTWVGYGRPRVG